jgi:hypothetical protein
MKTSIVRVVFLFTRNQSSVKKSEATHLVEMKSDSTEIDCIATVRMNPTAFHDDVYILRSINAHERRDNFDIICNKSTLAHDVQYAVEPNSVRQQVQPIAQNKP